MKNTNDTDFSTDIATGTVLVDFYAEWCMPCKALVPVLEKVSADQNLNIVKVNIDEVDKLPAQHAVRNVPTLILFKDGKEVARRTGKATVKELTEWLNQN